MILNKYSKPQVRKSKMEVLLSCLINRSVMLLLMFAVCIFILSGCQPATIREPQIIYGSNNIDIPEPTDIDTTIYQNNNYSNVPKDWIPPRSVEKKWIAIIVHHSATEKGNVAIFNQSHILEHGWDGIGYDFVIGNGQGSGDGEVEVTYRWIKQITGAHCKVSTMPENWANKDGIGICLVGNFNNHRPSQKQMQSLAKLINFLQKRYKIPKSMITGHGDTPGANITDCPGNMFPMATLKSMLNS